MNAKIDMFVLNGACKYWTETAELRQMAICLCKLK